MQSSPAYIFVDRRERLEEALRELQKATVIALDLEFDRDRYAYGFTLCLIQIGALGKIWLIDPMQVKDLEGLYRLLEQPEKVKVMHAPGEDLSLLHQKGCFPTTIFDTERAARILNTEAFSLGNVLQQYMGIELDKSQQRTDWTRRPLKDAQLVYAAQDVAYMEALRDTLLNRAKESELREMIEAENKAWDEYRVEERRPGWFANKDDEKKLPPFYLHVYNALLGVRDRYARQANKPGYMMMSREVAMDLVFDESKFQQWNQLHGLHPSMKKPEAARAFHEAYVAALREARVQQLEKRGQAARLNPEERTLAARKRHAAEARVERYLRPIQQAWIARWGVFAGGYLLNERVMSELASGRMRPSTMPLPYRWKIMEKTASELGISLEAMFNEIQNDHA